MEYRPFGRTGMQVSAIGFGCWETGGSYGHFDESEIVAAVNRAIDLGINCFDTAEGYGKGRSEEILARSLGSRRKDVLVVTKFGIGHEERERGRDSRGSEALAAIERSLKFLNTDYVDVYLVHWPDVNTPFEETMQALGEIVQAGKARFVGVSNFSPAQLAESMAERRVDVGQYGYHLFDRRMEAEVFPYCLENGVGVMAYGSLAHGLLAGTFTPETTFVESDWRSKGGLFGLKLFAPENFTTNLAVVDELKALAARRGKTVAHLALQWVLSNPVISVGLIGFRTAAEVEASVGGLSWSLSDEERGEIDAIFEKHEVDAAPLVWLEA